MKKEYFYNNLAYEVINTKRTIHGITCLLLSPGGNWIVANGVNIMDKTELEDITIFHGDWNHGHYFMENERAAKEYFDDIRCYVDFE